MAEKKLRIHSVCKNPKCRIPMEFSPEDTLRDQMYCSKECHQIDWMNNGVGLVDRETISVIRKHIKTYGEENICQEVLSNIEKRISQV